MKYNYGLVTIATVNFENLVNFYIQFLAQEPDKFIPKVYAEFQIANLCLGIFKPKKNNEAEFTTNNKNSLSLCLEVNDLKSAIAQITKLGYPPPGEIQTASHGQEIYVYDPDGNRLILHQSH
ncbi:MAG: VOC family protein [Sphaerospermopsis sp. SIO1G1]|nr:VOC family protein [Sphaerospermopsis sp. SIO1G1]